MQVAERIVASAMPAPLVAVAAVTIAAPPATTEASATTAPATAMPRPRDPPTAGYVDSAPRGDTRDAYGMSSPALVRR